MKKLTLKRYILQLQNWDVRKTLEFDSSSPMKFDCMQSSTFHNLRHALKKAKISYELYVRITSKISADNRIKL